MNERDLKRRLKEEGKNFVPDVRASLIDSLGLEEIDLTPSPSWTWGFKPLVVMVALVLIVFGFKLFSLKDSPPKPHTPLVSHTIVTVMINPSFEFEVDDDHMVVSYRALNVDAVPILEDLDITPHSTLEEVLEDLFQVIEETGYIDPTLTENSIQIQVINELEEKEELIYNRLEQGFNHRRVIIQRPTKQLRVEAKELGVSPNKLILIKKALDVDSTLTLEEALSYKIKELNEIIHQYQEDEVDNFLEEYRHYIKAIEQAINQKVKHYHNIYEKAMNRLLLIRRMVNRNNRKVLIQQLTNWMKDYLKDHNYMITDDTDIPTLIDLLEEDLNYRYEALQEAYQENQNLHLDTFKESVRQGLKQGEKRIRFRLDEDEISQLDDLFFGSYNREEREILKLVEAYKTLLKVIETNDWISKEWIHEKLDILYGEIIHRLDSNNIRESFKEKPELNDILENHPQRRPLPSSKDYDDLTSTWFFPRPPRWQGNGFSKSSF